MIEAAGGVLWDGSGERLLIVHRPRYDDWSLPKGKLDPGEDHATAAEREMHEETGFEVARGAQIGELRYKTREGHDKRVIYFTFQRNGGDFVPNDEVDAVRWVTIPEACNLLSYDIDRDFVATLGGK